MRGKLLVGVLAVMAVVGLGGVLTVGGYFNSSGSSYYDVLYDEDASADEVIGVADGPAWVAETDDGTRLFTYEIHDQEGGEEEKAALRLIDPRGDEVATELISPHDQPLAADDHFILVSDSGSPITAVDSSGRRTAITREVTDEDNTITIEGVRPAAGLESGDIQVGDWDAAVLYRPSTRTVHELPGPNDRAAVEQVRIAADRLWTIRRDGDLAAITSSRGSESDEVQLSLDQHEFGGWFDASPTIAAVAILRDDSSLTATEIVVAHGGAVTRLPMPEKVAEPLVVVPDDGRVVVGTSGGTWWKQSGGELAEMATPGSFDWIYEDNGQLFAIGDGTAWRSTDSGASWDELDL